MAEIEELISIFSDLCRAITMIGEASPRTLDAVASLGERMSVRLLAAVIEENGVNAIALDASELIVTNDHFQNAHPDFDATTRKTTSESPAASGAGHCAGDHRVHRSNSRRVYHYPGDAVAVITALPSSGQYCQLMMCGYGPTWTV